MIRLSLLERVKMKTLDPIPDGGVIEISTQIKLVNSIVNLVIVLLNRNAEIDIHVVLVLNGRILGLADVETHADIVIH